MVDVAELLRMTADAMASVKMPSGERGGLEPSTPRFKSHVLDRERISRAAPPSRSRESRAPSRRTSTQNPLEIGSALLTQTLSDREIDRLHRENLDTRYERRFLKS